MASRPYRKKTVKTMTNGQKITETKNLVTGRISRSRSIRVGMFRIATNLLSGKTKKVKLW